MEENINTANNVEANDTKDAVNNLIKSEVDKSTNVNDALDLMFTHNALKDEETLNSALSEKKEELRNKAEAKKNQAEAEKIKQEKEKQLAELDKEISTKEREVEKLKIEGDKAQAFFENNKDILSYILVTSKKSLKVMYFLMFPALGVFALIQIIALPFTIIGKLLEIIIGIIGGVCGAITNNSLKIIVGILVLAVLLAGGFAAYYYSGKIII